MRANAQMNWTSKMQFALPMVLVCCVDELQITIPFRKPRGGIHVSEICDVAATGNESTGTAPSAGTAAVSKRSTNCAVTLDTVNPNSSPGDVFAINEFATAPEFAFTRKRTMDVNLSGSA